MRSTKAAKKTAAKSPTTKTRATKATPEPTDLPRDRRYDEAGNDLSTVAGTVASVRAGAIEKAKADARCAIIAKQIAALIAKYDDAKYGGTPLQDVGDYLNDAEVGVLDAAGYLGIAKHDECGPGEDDIDEAMRMIAQVRALVTCVRRSLTDAGVIGARGEAVAS